MEGGGGRDEPSACRAGDVNMDDPKKEDILLLADEKFDFDLSLSSSSANEDDEVFFGPVGHKERCIAASLELNNAVPEQPPLPASESPFAWSPLAGEKFVEVYKEAHLLALQIESSSRNQAAQAAKPEDPRSQGVERFIQESKLKINLFEKEKEMKKSPTSLKRETYYLSDSPLLGPPVGEPRLLASSPALPSSGAQASLARAPGPPHSAHALPGESCTAHAPSQAATQRKPGTKLLLPRAASVRGRSIPGAAEKPKKEIPASPSRTKIPAEKESHRDVLPDKPAPGAVSVPAAGSHLGQGKRAIPVPNKLGLKKTLLKAPGSTSNLARKSSSGPVWSGASSACTSPAAGKGDSPDSSTPKLSRAQRPQSCTSVGRVTVHSTPVRRSSGPAPQSLLSARRVSALPTPASRRFSGLPPMTPKTMPRAVGSPLCVPAWRRSSEPRKNSAMRTEPTRESNRKTDSRLVDVSPDRGSPPSRVPQALNFSPEESDSTFSKSTATEVAREEAKPGGDAAPSEALLVDIKLDPLAVTPDAASQPLIDLPLIDFCDTPEAHVAVGSESRPLIDLMTNTPDMNKNVAKPSPVVGQLIDLSSPLIQLSPEADKENVDSPLLKF
ncbi:G2 and S phase-expressed protein 1 isoform X2 [Gorilla gorilla gorilla]|uniref:G2 and S phase-expressed protein 1 isoform X2 n=1 Tax=Gorilla gorilla gorilla TaxID=9595 RepID=UPI0024464226|nr:G2 and S phase-expressed protein 1 isoform X2 [Gorilla gorilla gorilla]